MTARVRVSTFRFALVFAVLLGTFSGCDDQSSGQAASASAAMSSAQTVSAELSWTAPSLNTDGTALTNLAGYRVYYGTEATALNSMVQIVGPSVTTCVLTDLSPGIYFFAIKSYNIDGTESDLSGVVSATI